MKKMTAEEILDTLIAQLTALSLSQRAILDLLTLCPPRPGPTQTHRAINSILDCMDGFVQQAKDKQEKALDEMAEYYEKEEKKPSEFGLMFKEALENKDE